MASFDRDPDGYKNQVQKQKEKKKKKKKKRGNK